MSLVAQDNDAAAERELRRAVELLSKDENDAVLLRLAAVLIQRGDSPLVERGRLRSQLAMTNHIAMNHGGCKAGSSQ